MTLKYTYFMLCLFNSSFMAINDVIYNVSQVETDYTDIRDTLICTTFGFIDTLICTTFGFIDTLI